VASFGARLRAVITVVGEALVDLVIDPVGRVTAALGGAPFNTARACGRLGVDVEFVGAMSTDRFGTMLRSRLVADGVGVADAPEVDVPTTLAAAELDDGGAASYRFYIEGTSAPMLTELPALAPGSAVFTGGLALVLEPMASTVAAMSVPPETLVVVDVNCRPLVIADRDAYVERVRSVVGRSHLVKVSDEDLDYLDPGVDHVTAARRLLDLGPRAVLVTGGGAGVRIVTAAGERFVPVDPVDVVDTIGAGDTFGGALLAWWTINGLGSGQTDDLDLLGAAVAAANTAAGIACTRRGAEPPRRAELSADWAG
jgi:fructokinase